MPERRKRRREQYKREGRGSVHGLYAGVTDEAYAATNGTVFKSECRRGIPWSVRVIGTQGKPCQAVCGRAFTSRLCVGRSGHKLRKDRPRGMSATCYTLFIVRVYYINYVLSSTLPGRRYELDHPRTGEGGGGVSLGFLGGRTSRRFPAGESFRGIAWPLSPDPAFVPSEEGLTAEPTTGDGFPGVTQEKRTFTTRKSKYKYKSFSHREHGHGCTTLQHRTWLAVCPPLGPRVVLTRSAMAMAPTNELSRALSPLSTCALSLRTA